MFVWDAGNVEKRSTTGGDGSRGRKIPVKGEWDADQAKMIPVQGPNEIPRFANEDEEDAFWSTHSIGDEWFARVGDVPFEQRPAASLRRLLDSQRDR